MAKRIPNARQRAEALVGSQFLSIDETARALRDYGDARERIGRRDEREKTLAEAELALKNVAASVSVVEWCTGETLRGALRSAIEAVAAKRGRRA